MAFGHVVDQKQATEKECEPLQCLRAGVYAETRWLRQQQQGLVTNAQVNPWGGVIGAPFLVGGEVFLCGRQLIGSYSASSGIAGQALKLFCRMLSILRCPSELCVREEPGQGCSFEAAK